MGSPTAVATGKRRIDLLRTCRLDVQNRGPSPAGVKMSPIEEGSGQSKRDAKRAPCERSIRDPKSDYACFLPCLATASMAAFTFSGSPR